MLAKIYRPTKTAMQSGKAGTRKWVLEFDDPARQPSDPLMGWSSDLDTIGQVRMKFDTKEQAIEFARARNIPHQVITPNEMRRTPRAYGDNFAFRRREPWSH